MPRYPVTLPDGRVVPVEASSPETAAEGAMQWAKANPLKGRAAADADARQRIKSTPAPVRAITQGASFGFADELDAAGAYGETAISNALTRLGGKTPRYSARDAFDAVEAQNNQGDARFAAEHPAANFGLQLAGGIATPGVAAGARFVGGARSLGGATLRSSLLGAGLGAVTGAGMAQGGLEERALGAAGGAGTGALLGAAMPGAGRLAQTAGRTVNAAATAATGGRFNTANRGAAARLREALHQDGLTEAQIRQRVADWQASGVTPEFLNVVGENTRALLRFAGGQPGAARNTAQGYRNATVASIPGRAQERAAQLTPGETRTPAQFVEDTAQRRTAEAAQNYPQWSNTPVANIPQAVTDMLSDPAGRQIVQRAMDDAVEHQDWARQMELQQLLAPPQSGQLPQVSAGTIERLVQAAGERSGDFAAHGAGIRAAGAMGRRTQLDNLLVNIPEVRPSRAAYADASRAIEVGADVPANPSVFKPASRFAPAIDEILGNAEAVRGAQIRERQRLVDGFGTRDQVKGILDDVNHAPDVRLNLDRLFGGEGTRFADAAGNLSAKQEHANFIAPNTGSQTQLRTGDAKGLTGLLSTAGEVLNMNVKALAERMARGLSMTEAERALLVQHGIGTPDAALRALSAPPGPVGGLLSGATQRAGVAAAPTVAGERQVPAPLEIDIGRSTNPEHLAWRRANGLE